MEKIRLFQADDHAIVRDGMRWLLMGEPDIELVGEADNGADAVEAVEHLQPDVILLDLHMPKMNGLQAITSIQERVPAAKILVITSFGDDDHLFPAIQAGAMGYMLKDSSPNDILNAIRDVAAGRSALPHSLAMRVLQEMKRPKPPTTPLTDDPLSQRELEIVTLIAQGLTNQEIADKLIISERTVRTHVSNILNKLHLANRTQAALYALRSGIAHIE